MCSLVQSCPTLLQWERQNFLYYLQCKIEWERLLSENFLCNGILTSDVVLGIFFFWLCLFESFSMCVCCFAFLLFCSSICRISLLSPMQNRMRKMHISCCCCRNFFLSTFESFSMCVCLSVWFFVLWLVEFLCWDRYEKFWFYEFVIVRSNKIHARFPIWNHARSRSRDWVSFESRSRAHL